MADYEFTGDREAFVKGVSGPDAWAAGRRHREIITKLICRVGASQNESICVFGAGPCNDIELNLISTIYSDVTLVDCDGAVLEQGVKDQLGEDHANVKLLGGVDLFGASQRLKQYKDSNDDSLIGQILVDVAEHKPQRLETYDCVASTCMLSQLLCEASEAIQKRHVRFVDVLIAIRLRHIQIMFDALKPGGHGILVTDIVSSESLPDLLNETDLKATLQQAIANQNFLHGLNPQMIVKVFQNESFADQLKSVRVSEPWRWVLPGRTYACFAIEFIKAA